MINLEFREADAMPQPVTYVISTNKNYRLTTVGKCVDSLLRNNISANNILVVNGGVEKGSCNPIEHWTHWEVNVPYTGFEHIGPAYIADTRMLSGYFFFLHDTCEAGPEFRKLVEAGINPEMDMTIISGGQCGFGTYKDDFIYRIRNYLFSIRNVSKLEAIAEEGGMFRKGMGSAAFYPNDYIEELGVRDVYQTGTPRLVERYTAVDLFKYKGNYGQTNPMNYIVTP